MMCCKKCAVISDTRWIGEMLSCEEDVDICFLLDWSRFIDDGLINVVGPKDVAGMRDNWLFDSFKANAAVSHDILDFTARVLVAPAVDTDLSSLEPSPA